MEVQIGNPIVRNNLIILDGPSPYFADDSLHHVSQNNNWYYQINDPALEYFPQTTAGNGNPKLIDLSDRDYHLSKDSLLRGKGINLSSFYSVDFEGNPLSKIGAWDIGAFQLIEVD